MAVSGRSLVEVLEEGVREEFGEVLSGRVDRDETIAAMIKLVAREVDSVVAGEALAPPGAALLGAMLSGEGLGLDDVEHRWAGIGVMFLSIGGLGLGDLVKHRWAEVGSG